MTAEHWRVWFDNCSEPYLGVANLISDLAACELARDTFEHGMNVWSEEAGNAIARIEQAERDLADLADKMRPYSHETVSAIAKEREELRARLAKMRKALTEAKQYVPVYAATTWGLIKAALAEASEEGSDE